RHRRRRPPQGVAWQSPGPLEKKPGEQTIIGWVWYDLSILGNADTYEYIVSTGVLLGIAARE
ncbi:MAG: hypothetical protein J4N63_06420, partial [Chloroflexi bacterium]|nr:hypothetical protein [Chloroflexota bacterium]